MSLVARITALAQAVGADIKALSANMLDLAGSRRMTGPVRFAAAPEVVLNNGQLDLAAATSNSVRGRIDGPILDLGSLPAGEVRTVRFMGGGSTAKLVYSYASIRLPANTDISLSEGDTAEFYSVAPGTWELRFFQRQDGTALVGTAAPVSSVAGKTGVVTLAKGDVGLGSVDNTADSAKPVSTAQATAIAAKATLAEALTQLQSFGVGTNTAPAIADLDTFRTGGFGQITNTQAAAAGLSLAVGHAIFCQTGANGASGCQQFASPLTSVSTNKNRLWHRQCFSGVWSTFQEFAYVDGVITILKGYGLGLEAADASPVASDANLTIVPGTYRMGSTAFNKPTSFSGELRVSKSYATDVFQEFLPSNGGQPWNRKSQDTGTTWSTWISAEGYGVGATSMPYIVNADDPTMANGSYATNSATTGTLPAGITFGVLKVNGRNNQQTNSGRVSQKFHVTDGTGLPREFLRHYLYGTNTWTIWLETQTVTGSLAQMQSYGLGQAQAGVAAQGSVVPTPAALGNTSVTQMVTVGGDTTTTDTATNHNPVSGETFSGWHLSAGLRPKQVGVSGAGSASTIWWRGYQGASAIFAEWRRASVHGAPTLLGQFTLTTLPSASAYSGHLIDVTNATGGVKTCRSNGTNWIILNTTTIVS